MTQHTEAVEASLHVLSLDAGDRAHEVLRCIEEDL